MTPLTLQRNDNELALAAYREQGGWGQRALLGTLKTSSQPRLDCAQTHPFLLPLLAQPAHQFSHVPHLHPHLC